MKPALACAALSLTLFLTACPGPDPVPVGCSALGGQTTSLSELNLALPQAFTPATNWGAQHVTGKLLIVSTGGSLSTQALNSLGPLKVQQVAPGLQEVQTPAGRTDMEFAAELQQAGLKVQPDFIYHSLATTNDPGFPGNAGIKASGLTMTQTYLTRTRVPEAWDTLNNCNLSLSGAPTAVVDTAVDASHPELQGRVANAVSQLPAGSRSGYDHGTAASGIIAANTNNSVGLSGIGWNQSLLSEEVLDSAGEATTSSVTAALKDAVARGAKVINLSLGMASNPGDLALDNALSSAANSAVLVAAAGNTNQDVYYPASHPAVIAVGSVGASDSTLACYSARPHNSARALDVVAPGGAGYGACLGATPAQDLLLLAPGGGYTVNAGTSFSAPQVSAVAALMRAANPNLTAPQTRSLLLSKVNTAGGLPLLDAAAAVTGAIQGR